MRIQDEAATVEDLIRVAPAIFRPKDESTIQDVITKTVFYRIKDTVTVQDTLSKTATMRVQDEAATVEDLIRVAPAIFRPKDAATVDESMRFTAIMHTGDDASVDDTITWTLIRVFGDEVTVDDRISKTPIYRLSDSASADDIIKYTSTMVFGDRISASDGPIRIIGSINIETRENGVLHPDVTQYRIIPDPFTGTGSLLVTDDGGATDYDDVANNGQISVFPVPLGTYRVNQTAAPGGYSSLINFTFATVHVSNINATALFAVFDKTNDPADLVATNSDILDIANYNFTELLENVALTRVDAGVQTLITQVDELPEPIFIGTNDPIGTITAANSQPTLLYKNLFIAPGESPENIRNSFAQTSYDAGNFTETTFVGVFAATENTTSSQYLATIPHDKFNCGQRYIYSLDNTLVPSYGGLKGFDLTIDQNGVCPDVQEDYLTFEITPSIGITSLLAPSQEVLLYVNPQFPRGSVTAAGVDFSNATNIDTFSFTLISPPAQLGGANGIRVFTLDGGLTTNGINIISATKITGGLHDGMIRLQVTADHLGPFIVIGRIPLPPEVPHPSGTGLVGVGPASGIAGGGDISVKLNVSMLVALLKSTPAAVTEPRGNCGLTYSKTS